MKVRLGVSNKTFWDVWKAQKDKIKALGIFVKENEGNYEGAVPPQWIVSHWKEV
jgi:hypothetical protein